MRLHPASIALRSGSAEQLHVELVATLSDGEQEWLMDFRDLMVELAPFNDCAQRLGLDAATVFRDAAVEGPESLRETVETFGARTDVTPSAFEYVVIDTADGPAYRYSR